MTVLADLLDDTTEIDETYGCARVEWTKDYQTGECQPVITWNENMRFHMSILNEDECFNLDTLAQQVGKALHDLFDGGDFNVDARWSDMDDEFDRDENGIIVEDEAGNEIGYPWLEITVWPVLNHPLDQDEDEAMGFLWPAIATLMNVTDPGTFNCPYLFDGLQEKKPEVSYPLKDLGDLLARIAEDEAGPLALP